MPFQGARRVLFTGIGGGSDAVGALATAEVAGAAGADTVVGGLTWERRPIDSLPGPRRLEPLNEVVALAGPGTRGPNGVRFAESHLAEVLGERTVLVDPAPGPAKVAAGLADAVERLGCDALALVDRTTGLRPAVPRGDMLAHGDEAGLASPLADAVLLAAARRPTASSTPSPSCRPRPARWPCAAPAEQTRMRAIRDGRRSVELGPAGALTSYLEPRATIASAARLADVEIG